MSILRERQKEEGILRMKNLVEKYELNPNLIKYLKENKIYYSYLTGNGLISSIDSITYDERFEKIVNSFERKQKSYVYHAIESDIILGQKRFKFLSLLYVSDNDEQWEYERMTEEGNYIQAYVHNINFPELSEIGDIFLDGFKGIGNSCNVLIRVG